MSSMPRARPSGERARHVAVAIGHAQVVDHEAVERATAPAHPSRDLAGERIGERSLVETLDEREVHRRRLEVDVLHDRHRPADHPRHAAAHARAVREHVHVADRVLEDLGRAGLVPDVERHPPAPLGGERGRDPGDIGERDRVADDVDPVVGSLARRPPDVAGRAAGGAGEREARQVERDGVPEPADLPGHVVEGEGRVALLRVEPGERDLAARRIRMQQPHAGDVDEDVAPLVGAREAPPARAPDAGDRIGEHHAHGGVARRPAERVGGGPRHRQREVALAHGDLLEHQQRPEARAAPRAARARRPRPDPLGVPARVEAATEVHARAGRVHGADEEAAVHEVARIERHPDGAGRREERVVGVPDLERVDGEVGDERPAQRPEPHRPLHRAAHLRLDDAADEIAPAHALCRRDERPDEPRADGEHQQGAPEHHEAAASHHARRPARWRSTSSAG
jgi:hypothetical protein